MADLERLQAGFFGILRLKPRDHGAAVVAQLAVLVEVGVVASTDEAAVPDGNGQLVLQRRRERGANRRLRICQGFGNLAKLARQGVRIC